MTNPNLNYPREITLQEAISVSCSREQLENGVISMIKYDYCINKGIYWMVLFTIGLMVGTIYLYLVINKRIGKKNKGANN